MISSVSKFLPLFESRARDRSVEFYLFEIRATRSRRRGGRDSRASRSAATPRPVARDGGHVCHPERPRLPAAAVAGEDPVGFGSPGGPGSRPRPPPARRLPGLSPGRGVRRGSRPRARGRPSQTSSQRSAPEYGRWVFAGRARWRWTTCDVLAAQRGPRPLEAGTVADAPSAPVGSQVWPQGESGSPSAPQSAPLERHGKTVTRAKGDPALRFNPVSRRHT